MPWITTKDGKHINTDWFDKDRQIAENKKQADELAKREDLNKQAVKGMTLKDIKYEEKKWAKRQSKFATRNRELENLQSATEFMGEHFGNISDLLGNVYIRSGPWSGLYDRDGLQGRGRATYFSPSGSGYLSEELMTHEFTHAVTTEIAEHYKELGFKSRDEVFNAMRSEIYANLKQQEPKYDNRKHDDRAEEFLSKYMEPYGRKSSSIRDAKALGQIPQSIQVGIMSEETLKVIKKWWKKIGR